MRKELGIGEDVKVVILNFGGQVSRQISLTMSSSEYINSVKICQEALAAELNLVANFASPFSFAICQDRVSSCSCSLISFDSCV